MRDVPLSMSQAWGSGDLLGSQAAHMRVTIQPLSIQLTPYRENIWASYLFGQTWPPHELTDVVKSVHWERTIDSDAATCTVTVYNTTPTPAGSDFGPLYDQPGYLTWRRGTDSGNRWGLTRNWWHDWIVPDRVMRTYEGYGIDRSVQPEQDPHMMPSGVWIIDDVELTHEGLITITARDAARLLMDHIYFPPVIPVKKYGQVWQKRDSVDNPDIVDSTGGWFRPDYRDDSGRPYSSPPGRHNAPVHGHYPSQAFDGSQSTYWMSIGNGQPGADYAFEWIEGDFSSRTISAVKAHVWGGGYTAYVSVYVPGDGWQGHHVIPYNPSDPVSAPNGANIEFVQHKPVDKEDWVTFKFKTPIKNATRVRITLTDLYNSGITPYVYRGGVRDVQVSSNVTTTRDGGKHWTGNYIDYTDLVKYLLAVGGFHWPKDSKSYLLYTESNTHHTLAPATNDPVLGYYTKTQKLPLGGTGRIWGDLENTGTASDIELTSEMWDKKPLMDGISAIRDIVNFIFYIDETGGAVWRSPNIWSIGNWNNGQYVTNVITIDETQTLMALTAKLTSRNLRERVFVANSDGNIGAAVKGWIEFPAGMRRVAGWTDQRFDKTKDCRIMADLIALRQLFTFQTNRIVIPGYSAIQIDDQIRVYERVTSEELLHYVRGISSDWERETGKWTYTIDTHWLGRTPFTDWAFDPSTMLSKDTKDYLTALGKLH